MKKKWKILPALLWLALIPFASMMILLASSIRGLEQPTGSLMLPAMSLMYFAIIALMQNTWGKRGSKIAIAAAALTVVMLAQMELDGARYLQYRTEQTDTIATHLSETIAREIGSEPGLPVVISGEMEYGNYPDRYHDKLKSSVKWLVQSYGTIWDDYSGTQNCWRMYLLDHKGILPYYSPSYECYERILETDEYKAMPCYPEEGSVMRFEDKEDGEVLVIKLGK